MKYRYQLNLLQVGRGDVDTVVSMRGACHTMLLVYDRASDSVWGVRFESASLAVGRGASSFDVDVDSDGEGVASVDVDSEGEGIASVPTITSSGLTPSTDVTNSGSAADNVPVSSPASVASSTTSTLSADAALLLRDLSADLLSCFSTFSASPSNPPYGPPPSSFNAAKICSSSLISSSVLGCLRFMYRSFDRSFCLLASTLTCIMVPRWPSGVVEDSPWRTALISSSPGPPNRSRLASGPWVSVPAGKGTSRSSALGSLAGRTRLAKIMFMGELESGSRGTLIAHSGPSFLSTAWMMAKVWSMLGMGSPVKMASRVVPFLGSRAGWGKVMFRL